MKDTTREQQTVSRAAAHPHKRARRTLLGCMASAVAFCTVYALTLPAITLEDKVYCGQEEHTHTDACYEQVLVCGYEEGAADGHIHDESCYQTETVLICGQEESDGHTHSESCFEDRSALICGQEETGTSGGHAHTDACYETRLVCGKAEHTHTLACRSNPEADTETAADWEKTLETVTLTGDWAQDLLAVADTQLGYAESTANYAVAADGATTKGYTRYGAWCGDPYGDWSAAFVSFCLNYAGIPTDAVPQTADCAAWVPMLSGQAEGYEAFDLYRAAGDYTPAAGDLVFFDDDADGTADRVGIAAGYAEATPESAAQLVVIEGDCDGKVQTVTCDAADGTILGYAQLPENPTPDADAATVRTITADAGDGVTFTAEGLLPAGAQLVAQKLTDEQVAYIGENFADVTLGAANYAYDIKICDADGNELELGQSVKITVSGLDLAQDGDVTGYHLTDVDADTLADVDAAGVDVQQVAVAADENGLTYDADGFSIMLFSAGGASRASAGGTAATLDSFEVSFVSGAEEQDGGTFVWTPTDTPAGHGFVYRVNYSVTGSDIPAGAIKITLPLHILKDRDNAYADKFDCPYVTETEATDNTDFVYSIDEANNTVTITNHTPWANGQTGYIEFSYSTSESTLNYKDMTKSDDVTVTMQVGDSTEQSATANGVCVNTQATISYTTKGKPTYYATWSETEWGEAPDDAENYYYLKYPVYSYIKKNTAPYSFSLKDTFSDMDGNVVMYQLSGEKWQKPGDDGSVTAENTKLTDYGYRYDYVLVRYSKEKADALVQSERTYSVYNTVQATVKSSDGVDAPSTATGSTSWTYQIPTYKNPGPSFRTEKYGLYGANDSHVGSSENASSYELADYLRGETVTQIDGLKYNAAVVAFLYPQTLEDGYSMTGTEADVEHYGKKAVTYVLKDDDVRLGVLSYNESDGITVSTDKTAKKLGDGDYILTGLDWDLEIMAAKYDSESKEYVATFVSDFNQTLIGQVAETGYANDTVYFYAQSGVNSTDWVKVAEYNMATKKYSEINEAYIETPTDDVKSLTFKEDAKVTGYKLETSNGYYYNRLSGSPIIRLNRTDRVAQILTGNQDATVADLAKLEKDASGNAILTEISVANVAYGSAVQEGKEIYQDDDIAEVYVQAVQRHSSLVKSAAKTQNDKANKQYIITWRSTLAETYADSDGTHFIPQESGTFYDLIPAGAVLDTSSIEVKKAVDPSNYSDTDGSVTLMPGEYTYQVIENYQNTGRQMLIVSVKENSEKGYRLTYSTLHSWESILDHSATVVNSVAYQTGNADIAGGQADDKTLKGFEGLTLTEDPENPSKSKTLVSSSKASFTINVLLAANTGLTKQVRAVGDTAYSDSTTAYSGGTYSYLLRFANDDSTVSDNIVLVDSLENYTASGKTSDWHGVLTGIDTTQLEEMGVAPTVYVSTVAGLDPNECWDEATKTFNLNATKDGQKVWQELTETTDLSKVTAVAVDCRKTAAGNFTLGASKSLTVTLYMSVPESIESKSSDPVAYNSVYAWRTAYKSSQPGNGDIQFVKQEYTQVHYRVVGDVLLTKVNAEDNTETIKGITYRLTGTSQYGTAYDLEVVSDKNGEFSFTDIEQGSYELTETACGSDWQLSTDIYTVEIDKTGKVTVTGRETLGQSTDGRTLIPDEPRIHGDLRILKQDSKTGGGLAGAKFILSGTSEYGNTVNMTAESGKDGTISFADIEYGTYTLTEYEAPSGYLQPKTDWQVVVNQNGQVTLYEADGTPTALNKYGTPVIENELAHTVTFIKTSTYGTNVRISGVEFTLTGVSDYGTVYDGTKAGVDHATSSADEGDFGVVKFSGLEPGTYTLRETSTANAKDNSGLNDGAGLTYTADSKTYTVVVSKDGTFTINGLSKVDFTVESATASMYSFPNTPSTGVVEVTKVWLGDEDGTEHETSDLDITISTELPDPSTYGGRTIIFDANGGTFTDGSTSNKVVYLTNTAVTRGTVVSGQYEVPTGNGTFLGWYVQKTNQTSSYSLNTDSITGFPDGSGLGYGKLRWENYQVTVYAKWGRTGYAVQLYSLNGGTEAGNENLGLTFGPALVSLNNSDGIIRNYLNRSVGHTVDAEGRIVDDESDKTHRCINHDTWEQIVYYNSTNPSVYEKCIENGCTKFVPLSTNGTTSILDSSFVGAYTGDGPTALYNELQEQNRVYAAVGDYANWETSRMRAMLNGTNTNTGDSVQYSETNSLLATFPDVLQKAIGARTINTLICTDNKNTSVVTTADKLWLLASGESDTDSVWTAKDANIGYYTNKIIVYNATNGISGVNEANLAQKSKAWLRSAYGKNDVKAIRAISDSYSLNAYTMTDNSKAVAPAFSLDKSVKGTYTPAQTASTDSAAETAAEEAVVAADTGSTAEYTTSGENRSWTQESTVKDEATGNTIKTYTMDTNNDNVYDIKLVCNGNTWTYYFNVADKSATYYVTESLNASIKDEYTLQDGNGSSIAYAVMQQGKATLYNVSTSYTLPGTGSLSLTKKLLDTDGTEVTGSDTTFTFDVALTYTGNSAGTKLLLSGTQTYGNTSFTWAETDGAYTANARVTLKAGETVTLTGIPAGVAYTVTEKTTGYTTEWTNQSGTIAKNTVSAVTCTNKQTTPTPEPVSTGSFVVSQNVKYEDGTAVEDTNSFTFLAALTGLTSGEEYRYTTYGADGKAVSTQTFTALPNGMGVAEFTLTNGQYIVFEGLPVGATYQVTEQAAEGYTASYEVTNATAVVSATGKNETANTALATAAETLDEDEAGKKDVKDSVWINFTNTLPTPTPADQFYNIKVNKVWSDSNDSHIGTEVTIRLMRALTQDDADNNRGDQAAYVTLDGNRDAEETTAWQYIFTNMPRNSDEVDEETGEKVPYIYYVVEDTVAGCSAQITKNEVSATDDWDMSFTVTNTQGIVLPNSGGIGTNWFTFGGLALMAGALVYGYVRRRKERGLKQSES